MITSYLSMQKVETCPDLNVYAGEAEIQWFWRLAGD